MTSLSGARALLIPRQPRRAGSALLSRDQDPAASALLLCWRTRSIHLQTKGQSRKPQTNKALNTNTHEARSAYGTQAHQSYLCPKPPISRETVLFARLCAWAVDTRSQMPSQQRNQQKGSFGSGLPAAGTLGSTTPIKPKHGQNSQGRRGHEAALAPGATKLPSACSRSPAA